MKTTWYFEHRVKTRPDRPEARRPDWIEYVLTKPTQTNVQENGRIQHWRYILEAKKWLRVVTLADGVTVINTFFDRDFRKEKRPLTTEEWAARTAPKPKPDIGYDPETDALMITWGSGRAGDGQEVALYTILSRNEDDTPIALEFEGEASKYLAPVIQAANAELLKAAEAVLAWAEARRVTNPEINALRAAVAGRARSSESKS